jgi:L-amino acid N-acyltransferase YncA
LNPSPALPAAISIRNFAEADWPAVWAIIEPVFRAGDTYSFARDISEQEARRAWIDAPARTFVAVDNTGQVLGTYFIKANQPGQGGHVCNCGYIVAASARGKGIASALCEHSQCEAVKLGFRAMQYNLVVSTNTGAVRLWKKLGFDIVGTLPKAFLHPTEGFVDAHILYKMLEA